MRFRFATLASALLAACVGPPARAEPSFALSGFGTLGYVVTNTQATAYRTGRGRDGADSSGSFEVDSRLGLQLDTGLTDTLSGTLQLLARQDGDGEFTPEIEWAFLKAQINDSTSVRLGRIGGPYFMVSDFREVGYANTLLRPPEDTYVQVPISSFDGIDVNYIHDFDETLLGVQLHVGQSDRDFGEDFDSSLRDAAGINATLEHGPARVRVSYNRARLAVPSAQLDALSAALEQAAALLPAFEPVARDFEQRYKHASFTGLGLELDLDPWFVAGEYTLRRIEDSFLSDTDAWYLAAGYRWRNLTPYAYVSSLEQISRTEANVPPVAQLAELAATVQELYSAIDQQSLAVGVRWDFAPNLAFKAQFENIERQSPRSANFYRTGRDASDDPADARLLSLGVDFIF